ncbi:hypothetical protein D0Z07_7566 [Hyphodiscus hymeniophilus]|uniref:BTB domain-containing protein n=1 Tax=Hyphodiscus hymeniophilus TaxID=353542 RepID=A0A9P6VEU3_9HELO|nr:hypothetical protein D0Z07_7566 [Hyphodiscus hymeniophilus]
MSNNSNISNILPELYKSGRYSDMTVKCQGREWKVHRNIVCSQSKPLAAALDGNFEEASTGVINLDDDELETVERALFFLYNSNYPDGRCSVVQTITQTPGG